MYRAWRYLYGQNITILKKIMDGHFSDIQSLLKNWHKSDSFSAHYGQHFKSTMSRTDSHKCMAFKLVIQINPIIAMNSFMKRYCNLCAEENLSILKNLHEKNVTLMNKKLEIYEACRHKTTFHRFFLSTDDTINGWKGYIVQRF